MILTDSRIQHNIISCPDTIFILYKSWRKIEYRLLFYFFLLSFFFFYSFLCSSISFFIFFRLPLFFPLLSTLFYPYFFLSFYLSIFCLTSFPIPTLIHSILTFFNYSNVLFSPILLSVQLFHSFLSFDFSFLAFLFWFLLILFQAKSSSNSMIIVAEGISKTYLVEGSLGCKASERCRPTNIVRNLDRDSGSQYQNVRSFIGNKYVLLFLFILFIIYLSMNSFIYLFFYLSFVY